MDSEDQSQRGTQLLEIYALEIQMHNETRNVKKLKASKSIGSSPVVKYSHHRKYIMRQTM